MSLTKGDRATALQNRNNFLSKHNLCEEDVVSMNLTHSVQVTQVYSKNLSQQINADALISSDPNVPLFMLTGDCIPLAISDPRRENFSLIHCSWDTLNSGILKVVSEQFLHLHSELSNLVAIFGPSIGPCCYFQKNPQQKNDPNWKPFIKPLNETYSIDLWSYTKHELLNLGLKEGNIVNPQICTYHSGDYFSHHKFIKEQLQHDYRFATLLKPND